MATDIGLFDYDLPHASIAQSSVEPRDASKLLVLDRATGAITHRVFRDIVSELRAGDVLVRNVTKVFRARLLLGAFEVFVLRVRDGEIEALVKPGRKCAVGAFLPSHGEGKREGFSVRSKSGDGIVTFTTGMTASEMFAYCDAHGEVPTPPYVDGKLDDASKYQTVYAKETGSVAAPTAGFHFTPELFDTIRAKGVQIEEVVLHVGIGTFRPVKTLSLEDHIMHSEFVSIDAGTAGRINAAKREGRRVIAVGTTTVRALEGVAALNPLFCKEGVGGGLRAYDGEVNLFITPGFTFKIIDGLITNFHLPKSTLLVLVSAFAGRERVLAAYKEAKHHNYRFFSFGDAMLIR